MRITGGTPFSNAKSYLRGIPVKDPKKQKQIKNISVSNLHFYYYYCY